MIPAPEFDAATPATPAPLPEGAAQLDQLAETATRLGYRIVGLAGGLDEIEAGSRRQVESLFTVRRCAGEVISANTQVCEAAETLTAASQGALAQVESSSQQVREAAEQTQELAAWVQSLDTRMGSVEETLKAVQSSNEEIAAIASQVNILAINAKIEAARAGDAGRGFAVVAEAINELSQKTAGAAEGISGNIRSLSDWVTTLREEAEGSAGRAARVRSESDQLDTSLEQIAQGVRQVSGDAGHIARNAEEVRRAIAGFEPGFAAIGSAIEDGATQIRDLHDKTEGLIDMSEGLMQASVAAGGASTQARFIDYAQTTAAEIVELFETALQRGQIDEAQLFSEDYRPVPGTNPEQVLAPFTALTDALLPPLLERALEFDASVVFCAAVDRNGYLPTHNRRFSQPQGQDVAWNAANSRNRRIFDDRVGLKAGRNTAPFLLQVYRRDMGGGQFTMMNDLSAPIRVKGRHWGGLRLAYTC